MYQSRWQTLTHYLDGQPRLLYSHWLLGSDVPWQQQDPGLRGDTVSEIPGGTYLVRLNCTINSPESCSSSVWAGSKSFCQDLTWEQVKHWGSCALWITLPISRQSHFAHQSLWSSSIKYSKCHFKQISENYEEHFLLCLSNWTKQTLFVLVICFRFNSENIQENESDFFLQLITLVLIMTESIVLSTIRNLIFYEEADH